MTGAASDVVILGSGPAGAAAALLLTRWGHVVSVRTKRTRNASLVESIPPSTGKLIDLLGLRTAFDRAGFLPASGNVVLWGGRAPRVEGFENAEHGWHACRAQMADVLLAELESAGIAVGPPIEGGVPEGEPGFVLDCTGRAGVIARGRQMRVYDPGPRTVALTGVWQASPTFHAVDPAHTLIESYEGGWAWSCPQSPALRNIAVMVDPATSGLARGRSARELYLHEIGRTVRVAALAREATLVDGPAGWDASMYHASRYADGNALLVGDAASFVDPLSSAGVKKAFASGWLAAVAVHTALRRPSLRDVAVAFYEVREAEVYESLRTMIAATLAAAAAGHDHPFWGGRGEPSDEAAGQPSIAAAFEQLRAAPALRVRVDPIVRVESRPAISGNEIVLEARVVSPDQPAGMRYAFDVDLIGVLAVAPAASSVPDAFDAYNARYAPAALPDFLGALSTALARKWLVWV